MQAFCTPSAIWVPSVAASYGCCMDSGLTLGGFCTKMKKLYACSPMFFRFVVVRLPPGTARTRASCCSLTQPSSSLLSLPSCHSCTKSGSWVSSWLRGCLCSHPGHPPSLHLRSTSHTVQEESKHTGRTQARKAFTAAHTRQGEVQQQRSGALAAQSCVLLVPAAT